MWRSWLWNIKQFFSRASEATKGLGHAPGEQSSMSFSQVLPVKPGKQSHAKPGFRLRHCPLFLHGELTHSLISLPHVGPGQNASARKIKLLLKVSSRQDWAKNTTNVSDDRDESEVFLLSFRQHLLDSAISTLNERNNYKTETNPVKNKNK